MTQVQLQADVSSATREAFSRAGVGILLDRAVTTVRETIGVVDATQTLLSSTPVVDVLAALPYDTDDSVYVLWRADGSQDFWTQVRKERYLAHLQECATQSGGSLNQTRVMVYDDSVPASIATPDNILRPDHILFSLAPLHRAGSLLSLPRSALDDYPRVAQLRFGCTVSSRHGYAVVPIPFAEDLAPGSVAPERLGQYLGNHGDYDEAEGPMRAVVSVNGPFVRGLLNELRDLASDDRVHTI